MILPPYTAAKLKVVARGLRPTQAKALKAFAEWGVAGMPGTAARPTALLAGLATLGLAERLPPTDRLGGARWRLSALGVAVCDHLRGGKA